MFSERERKAAATWCLLTGVGLTLIGVGILVGGWPS